MPTSANGARLRLTAALLLFALVTGVLMLRAWRLTAPPRHGFDPKHWVMTDFRDQIYFPCRAFLDGEDPYDGARIGELYPVATLPVPYSPANLIVYQPFAWLPVGAAETIYFLLTLAATVALAALALRVSGAPGGAAAIFFTSALLLASRPGHWNWLNGQSAAQLALAATAAIAFAETRPWLAGAALAFATVKPTWGVPLAILLAARGAWRTFWIAVALATPVTLLPVVQLVRAAHGVQPLLDAVSSSFAVWARHPMNLPARSETRIDAIVPAARLFQLETRPLQQTSLTLAILTLAAFTLWRLGRDARVRPLAAALICSTVLVCAYHQNYDLLILTGPAIALVRGDLLAGQPRLRQAALALVLVLGFNYFASVKMTSSLGEHSLLRLAMITVNPLCALALFAMLLAAAWLETRPTRGQRGLSPRGWSHPS